MNEELLARLLRLARAADQRWLDAEPDGRHQAGTECDFAWRAYSDAYNEMYPIRPGRGRKMYRR